MSDTQKPSRTLYWMLAAIAVLVAVSTQFKTEPALPEVRVAAFDFHYPTGPRAVQFAVAFDDMAGWGRTCVVALLTPALALRDDGWLLAFIRAGNQACHGVDVDTASVRVASWGGVNWLEMDDARGQLVRAAVAKRAGEHTPVESLFLLMR
jgi:hypothetical protein